MPDPTTAWIRCADRLPERGVVVDTATGFAFPDTRSVQPLKRGAGNLWFTPDGTMYVYYEPTHWRPHA